MTAIVSGASLGLPSTSAYVPGLQKGDPATGRSGEGATVNVATDNLIKQCQDKIPASRRLDITTRCNLRQMSLAAALVR